ncbi:hypothetical protein BJAS_P2756 [Bathymodiolus japonicus methanotrophic gill symbiont]|uniref:hypothetical protein n=1 Tax=Bathymodiolus japonicus methanotrophic gill symbiont TaxID=113269 RepID=UPI001B41242A|nr:hypothetical protein [Bathymodiolus japonicus methanotrophic gill symbiont]GFO72477.1 hypothetical protein BJAS_P2756 [Bathymodiolus japonicus methanotrophic gill symbiont]
MIKIEKMEIFEWCYLQVGYRLLCLGTSSFNGNTDDREGDLRLSPHSFARSAEDLLLWCDLLESAISPDSDTAEELPTEAEKVETKLSNIFSEPSPVTEVVQDSSENKALPNNHDLADELTRLARVKSKGFFV